MKPPPHIAVAPNGARLQKSDHAIMSETARELAETARRCQAKGANSIHLHVRDADSTHSLDPALYRAAISEISDTAPGMKIQVTTEAADRYDIAQQLLLLRELAPEAANIAVREIARAPELAAQVYATAQTQQTPVQHILYGTGCLDQLVKWLASGIVPPTMRDAILVLGQYVPPRTDKPGGLGGVIKQAKKSGWRMTVCAFGPREQACLIAAADLGCDMRVEFENNILAPDGSIWPDNAEAVSSLRNAFAARNSEGASSTCKSNTAMISP